MTVRNGFVDYCRLVAAAGIVWFHSDAPGFRVAYAALPFFLVLLAQPTKSSIAERARRLLLPFVIWSAIYAVLWIAVANHYGLDTFVWWRPWMLVAGTSVHLWFLPFAFVVSLGAPALRHSKATLFLPLFAAIGLALLGETRAFPWYQWSFGIVPALIGFAYTRNARIAAIVLLSSYLVLEIFRPSPDNFVIFLGSALAILAFSIQMPATALSQWSARISMWVYLIHMIVIFFVETREIKGASLALITLGLSIVVGVCIEIIVRNLKPSVG